MIGLSLIRSLVSRGRAVPTPPRPARPRDHLGPVDQRLDRRLVTPEAAGSSPARVAQSHPATINSKPAPKYPPLPTSDAPCPFNSVHVYGYNDCCGFCGRPRYYEGVA